MTQPDEKPHERPPITNVVKQPLDNRVDIVVTMKGTGIVQYLAGGTCLAAVEFLRTVSDEDPVEKADVDFVLPGQEVFLIEDPAVFFSIVGIFRFIPETEVRYLREIVTENTIVQLVVNL